MGTFVLAQKKKGKYDLIAVFPAISEKERGGGAGPLASVFVGGGGKAYRAAEKNGPFCLFFLRMKREGKCTTAAAHASQKGSVSPSFPFD